MNISAVGQSSTVAALNRPVLQPDADTPPVMGGKKQDDPQETAQVKVMGNPKDGVVDVYA